MPEPIVALVGATASGKTGLSLDLAERLGGEVVNTDAMQVYRGMDIGTAKLPPAERRGIAHHLLDLLDVTEPATVAQFQVWARDAIGDIRRRGGVPMLVGGSALYTRAIIDRFEFPGTDESLRRELEAELERVGSHALHPRLAGVDPAAAAQIMPDNGRRVVRALEVIALTGRPYSASLPGLEYADPLTIQIGVDIDRPTLDERIGRRVDEMFAGGFVDEVEALLTRGLAQGRTAPARSATARSSASSPATGPWPRRWSRPRPATRRFSRRQDGWFRKDQRIVWIDHDDPERVDRATGRSRRWLSGRTH